MIDKSSRIVWHIAIEIVAFIDVKNVNCSTAVLSGSFEQTRATPFRFGLGDFFADILNDPGIPGNVANSEHSPFVNPGMTHFAIL